MDDLGEHISFLMDSDIEPDVGLDEDNDDDEEEEAEEEVEDHFDSDFDAIDFGIQERIRKASKPRLSVERDDAFDIIYICDRQTFELQAEVKCQAR